MNDNDLIRRGDTLKAIDNDDDCHWWYEDKIEKVPAVDAVPTEVLRQVQWERDIAIQQLAEYGVGFGEKKKDLVEVEHGQWIKVNEHMWRKCDDGEIDEFAWDGDYHNGPVCELCHATPCIHCNPDWENSECYVTSYRCSECNEHVKNESNYCPNCGADMRGREEV